MKIIVEKQSGDIKYVFDDSESIVLLDYQIKLENKVICDLNNINSILIENVTLPNDFELVKYLYIDGNFIINEAIVI